MATDVKLWILNNSPCLKENIIALIDVGNQFYFKKVIIFFMNYVKQLFQALVNSAKVHIDVLMPGYTHLRRAQPVRWSHFILSHAWNLREDVELLKVLMERVAVLPLGSGALAGNPFPIDRSAMADELGFSSISMNSMNAVGNRDFIG